MSNLVEISPASARMPCPFCGCGHLVTRPSGFRGLSEESVLCLKCQASAPASVWAAQVATQTLPKLDTFLTDRLRMWKDEGVAAPLNELQSIQAWLRCLGEYGATETAQRMRGRMLLLMKVAGASHEAGPLAEDAAGIYEGLSRESVGARNAAKLTKPIFYVASRASNPDRPRMWVEMRDTHGFNINSSWVDAAAAGSEVEFDLLWEAIAAEIARCDCLVLYVAPEDFPLKGAFVEVGMALAGGKPIRIVAPGVKLDPLDCKPLGSWAKHPLVKFVASVEEAFSQFRK